MLAIKKGTLHQQDISVKRSNRVECRMKKVLMIAPHPCDLLSIILCVNGEPLLVNSASYKYHGA